LTEVEGNGVGMKKTMLWKFLVSVKFALVNFIVLAAVSIIGTVISQNEGQTHYVEKWGENIAAIILQLGLNDMFNAWWYTSLLGLFGFNLLLCTIDRLPNALRLCRQDSSQLPYDRVRKMTFAGEFTVPGQTNIASRVEDFLKQHKWLAVKVVIHDNIRIISAHKGHWSRLGAYIVHVGILVVLIGAIWGKMFGFTTSVMIPEGPMIAGQLENAPVPLTFEMRCDWFAMEYYKTGSPKQYRSAMVLIQDGKPVLQQTLEVNGPITFDGITLYQDTYKPLENQYSLKIRRVGDHESMKVFQLKPHEQKQWQEEGIVLGIAKTANPFLMGGDGHDHGPRDDYRHQLAFAGSDGKAQFVWVNENQATPFEFLGNSYELFLKQRYYTGLQIVKDPGVWIVYCGFLFMLFGLYVVFFQSHRKVWVILSTKGEKQHIEFRGTANKNKKSFLQKLTMKAGNFSKSI